MKIKFIIATCFFLLNSSFLFAGDSLDFKPADQNLFSKVKTLKKGFNRPGPYNIGIGVCWSGNSGICFKKFIAEESAFEIILATRWQGITLTGFYEVCVGAIEPGTGLNWAVGLGPRFGFYQGKNFRDYLGNNKEDRMYSVLGFAGTFGCEYVFKGIPISLGVDYRPYIDLKGKDDSLIDGSVILKFVF